MSTEERRRYFRINDLVGLSYRPMEEVNAELQEGQELQAENVQIAAVELLKSIDKEIMQSLNTLWQNNAMAANTLDLINKKIDILAAEINLDYNAPLALQDELVAVNISACGIAFESDEYFNSGQRLQMHITLKPTNRRLDIEGVVIACEKPDPSADTPEAGPEKRYFLRIAFHQVQPVAEEELIQHLVRRQSGQIARQRDNGV